MLNAIVESFLSVTRDLKMDKLSALASVLKEQRAYAQRRLREAEEEGGRYRRRLPSPLSPVPGLPEVRDPVFPLYWHLKREQEEVRADRAALDRLLTRDPSSYVVTLPDLPAVQRHSPELMEALS
jgi:hypothetical protein